MKKIINRALAIINLIGLIFSKYGLKGAVTVLFKDVLSDYKNGIDTFLPVAREELFDESNVLLQNRYVPSTYKVVDDMLDHARAIVDFSVSNFVDFGSGKGKVVIGAAKHNFKQVKGIEYSDRLHKIAINNITKLGLEDKTVLLNMDATKYKPSEDDGVFYFFNPFMGDILDQVLKNIAETDNGGKRRVYLYVNPVNDDIFKKYFDKLSDETLQPGNVHACHYIDRE